MIFEARPNVGAINPGKMKNERINTKFNAIAAARCHLKLLMARNNPTIEQAAEMKQHGKNKSTSKPMNGITNMNPKIVAISVQNAQQKRLSLDDTSVS